MKAYYSEGGARKPYFPHVVKIYVVPNEMMDWLRDFTSLEDCRYWIDFETDNGYEFTFESHKDATVFALKWA